MYKCSAKASLVLDQVRSRCQEDTQTNNKWRGRSGNYMYIMGRENADGKATGVVHKIAEDGSHKLCGSFKIMSDGIITRFTGLSKADWNNAMRNAEAESSTKQKLQNQQQNKQLQYILRCVQVSGFECPRVPTRPMQEKFSAHTHLRLCIRNI